MKLDEEDIKKVLALFDEEDIPYINYKYLINNYILDNDNKSNNKVKTKNLVKRNDKARK
ncbi:MAG: hypothetical protein IKF19_05635 [Bacilli bacterium]|nr:hypothetical protein [Bacilli bacterium]